MCGRYTIHADTEQIIRRFLLDRPPRPMPARYNVAPTQTIPVVRLDASGQRVIEPMRWGLVPSWADDPSIGARMINARAESLADKPAFSDALAQRRCLVIADGFYEWRKDPGGKTPIYIRRLDHQPFAFAGLWDTWADKATGEELRTCAIITTDANELLRPIHDRMPAMLRAEDEERWLAGTGAPADLLRPYPAAELEAFPVSRRVNRATDDDPACIEPAEPEGMLFQ